jgi:uncharacterized SAM-binding protein YcdF (DUF218 family)
VHELPSRQLLGGVVVRKERWGLSWTGWILLLVVILSGAALGVRHIHPFLAKTHRIPTRYLVVEGWIHDYGIDAALVEFRTGVYEFIVTTGGPVQGSGPYTNDFNTSASVAADRLIARGASPERVYMVPSRVVDRDRTYSSARALRTWLESRQEKTPAITILTEALHARRSRLLFELAFEGSAKVGIIAVPNPDYDARRWWYYSEGVREVLGESIAYLYARLFFHPDESQDRAAPSKANNPP